jgi:hypothetical protein
MHELVIQILSHGRLVIEINKRQNARNFQLS